MCVFDRVIDSLHCVRCYASAGSRVRYSVTVVMTLTASLSCATWCRASALNTVAAGATTYTTLRRVNEDRHRTRCHGDWQSSVSDALHQIMLGFVAYIQYKCIHCVGQCFGASANSLCTAAVQGQFVAVWLQQLVSAATSDDRLLSMKSHVIEYYFSCTGI
eukprot:2205-Heterococcus_DN1.PRE.4